MIAAIALATAVTMTSLGGTGVEPTFEFGFDMNHPDGTTILGSPGETVRVEGFLTLTASEAGVGGFTQSVEVRSPTVTAFCIDARLTESFTPSQKQELMGVCLLTLFPDPTTYVIQDGIGSCRGGGVSPDRGSNNGRRGLVDSTVVCIGRSLPQGTYRTLPVAVDMVVASPR